MTAEREAEIRELDQEWETHCYITIETFKDLGIALRDVLAELDRIRAINEELAMHRDVRI